MKIKRQIYYISFVIFTAGCLMILACGCGGKKKVAAKEESKELGVAAQIAGEQQLTSYQKARSALGAVAKIKEEQTEETDL